MNCLTIFWILSHCAITNRSEHSLLLHITVSLTAAPNGRSGSYYPVKLSKSLVRKNHTYAAGRESSFRSINRIPPTQPVLAVHFLYCRHKQKSYRHLCSN